MQIELKPCPFCGGAAHIAQPGTRRRSCVVECDSCGLNHESGDEGEMCGTSWNRRTAAHSAGAQRVTNIPERQRGESFRDWAKRTYELQDAQPMPQTDAARDAEDAKRYRFIKSQMKVGAVQTQLPLYRTLHWIGYEDCSDVHSADAAIDAEIERLDGAKGE